MAPQLSGPEQAVRAKHRSERRLHEAWVPPAPHSASRLLSAALAGKEEDARVTLGVGPGAAAEEVREAFRRLVLRHHPDRGNQTCSCTCLPPDRSCCVLLLELLK